MKTNCSRRDFLAAGLVLPAAGIRASSDSTLPPAVGQARPESIRLDYRMLGKTGLKVTSLSFGCMTTSDPSVIERAADFGINHFDTARVYQNGNNERMCGACGGVCERGVPVPDVLRFLTYAEGYGQFALARKRFLELPQPVRDIRCSDWPHAPSSALIWSPFGTG